MHQKVKFYSTAADSMKESVYKIFKEPGYMFVIASQVQIYIQKNIETCAFIRRNCSSGVVVDTKIDIKTAWESNLSKFCHQNIYNVL